MVTLDNLLAFKPSQQQNVSKAGLGKPFDQMLNKGPTRDGQKRFGCLSG